MKKKHQTVGREWRIKFKNCCDRSEQSLTKRKDQKPLRLENERTEGESIAIAIAMAMNNQNK